MSTDHRSFLAPFPDAVAVGLMADRAAGAYCRGRMPEVWTPDDVRFAVIRAVHLGPRGQIVDDLLAAAEQTSSRLDGVTAFGPGSAPPRC
jgi:hypothetical protein